jgi:hypothetical protein
MGKINASTDLTNVPTLKEAMRFVSQQFQQIASAVNGNLNFPDNFRCFITVLTFPPVAQQVLVINHGLGFVPKGFLVVDKVANLQVWRDAGSALTESQISLRCSVAAAQITLLVF